jgi:hypothetical protein
MLEITRIWKCYTKPALDPLISLVQTVFQDLDLVQEVTPASLPLLAV